MLNRFISQFRNLPKAVKVLVYVFIGLFVVGIIANVVVWASIRFFPVEARYRYTTMGTSTHSFIIRTRAFHPPDYNISYFHSIEEAMDAYFGVRRTTVNPTLRQSETPSWRRSIEIKRFVEDQEMLVIAVINNNNLHPFIGFDLFLIDGDMISYPLYLWSQDTIGCPFDLRRIYFDEDRIARDIMWAFAAEHVTSRVNGGIPIYYGVGVGSPPQYMSILGFEPDEIMSFSHGGNEYFFWHYRDTSLFSELFTKHFTFVNEHGEVRTRTLRFGDIIDVFDIQIVRWHCVSKAFL